jgi:hypothetical protein
LAIQHSKPEIAKILSHDPRAKKTAQERIAPPTLIPTRFRRVAKRGRNWHLSRSIRGYGVQLDSGVGGQATKWVLKKKLKGADGKDLFNEGKQLFDTDDFYIAKFGNKNGRIEIFSELFNNQLGSRLGFEMAHSGLARLDEHLYFVTKSFRSREDLIHGSLMIEQVLEAKSATQDVNPKQEQEFYSVDFLRDVIFDYCGEDGEEVFQGFIDMMVLDALIGSMDRHAQNWGVLKSQTIAADGKQRCRFSPIYDSARALLWDLPEGKLLLGDLDINELQRYVEKSKPCIGPPRNHPKVNKCNHFDFLKSLLELFPHQNTQVLC